MRIAYLDEGGMSNKKEEPYLIVAGFILDPDQHWNKLEATIRSIATNLAKKDQSNYNRPYIFHAMDIWHGSGDFPRSSWPLQKRMELLEKLCMIPATLNLPIIFGQVNREKYEPLFSNTNNPNDHCYSQAFISATARLDEWMESNAPNEVAMVIAEANDSKKHSIVDYYHAAYTDRSVQEIDGVFQSKHIVEQVSFMRKEQSPVLQLADICSFILKRKLQKCKYIDKYFDLLRPQIWFQKGDRSRVVFSRVPAEALQRVK